MSRTPLPESPGSERMAAARAAFAARFPDEQSRSDHYRELGKRSGEARRGSVFLAPDEAAALGEAYRLLERIAARVESHAPVAGMDGER